MAYGTHVANDLRVSYEPVKNQASSSVANVNGRKEKAFPRHWKLAQTILFICAFVIAFPTLVPSWAQKPITDENSLALPEIGAYGLRLLSPSVLELTYISTKQPNPAHVSAWDFVDGNFNATLPPSSEFSVMVDGKTVAVFDVGFKRRVLYAPQTPGDLRIANQLYLTLEANVADSQTVQVTNPSGTLWKTPVEFSVSAAPLRYSPAIHVNQAGYMPNYVKKAMVGYYLGSLGELPLPTAKGFQLLSTADNSVVFTGSLKQRADVGFSYSPLPYQQVYEADFTSFTTPGEYRLFIPDLGTSFPFRIDSGVTANFARTFALGLMHQRCGTANQLPYTRYTHEDCHIAPAEVPTMDPQFQSTQDVLNTVTGDYLEEATQTAPRLANVSASLYPFVNQGPVDVSGGHHDAGDYSKYTINSAGLIHFLVFAADSFAGVGELDNLGLPESGDGKSDILQEAKWEADFLAKMQDADGGFYFLVYPKKRRYENNVLPDHGDPQVVWPKTTSVTAAAVAALAEAGSSPLMKKQFPAESARYLQKAQLGWTFLMNALDKYGKVGAYQKITHYGNEFGHDDELAWAAAAMYAATGDAQYEAKLFEFFPNPNDVSTRRWTWWRLFEGYGCAVRTYAFAARSGRLDASKLNASYLAKCEAEILTTADDQTRFSKQNAYGTSFPDTTKQYRSPGWYFSSERAFDVTVGYQLSPRPEYLETVVANFNYEGGSNPLNMPFVTGLGVKRQREVVSQYAWNDHRILPPGGLPQGNIRPGYGYLETYLAPGTTMSELPYLSYPSDVAETAPYAYYDRWTDMIDTMTEFVVMDQARSLASHAFWMAQGPAKEQSWKPVLGQIVGLDSDFEAGKATSISITASGLDLSKAQVTWETRFLEPVQGNPVAITPKFSGDHWIEAEAVLPDGRRVVAVSNFVASSSRDTPPNSFQSGPVAATSDVAALYHLDWDLGDATGKNAPLALAGKAHLEKSNLAWMAQRGGAGLRFLDLHDTATVQIPTAALSNGSDTTEIVLEGMIYVNEFKAFDRDVATIFALIESYNNSYLEFREDKYMGPVIQAGNVFSFSGTPLKSALTTKEWHHMSIAITRSGYVFKLDGKTLASLASAELDNWGRGVNARLVLGNFDGWIDEVVVRSVRSSAAAAPSVTLDSGLARSYSFPGALSIGANASTASGSVAKVEFFAGATKIGEDVTAPFSINWTIPAVGNYSLTAKATDSAGNVGISAPINVTVVGNGRACSLMPIGPSPDGFRLRINGEAGNIYIIQASENSVDWTDVGGVAVETSATQFIDSTKATNHRFYRALLLQ